MYMYVYYIRIYYICILLLCYKKPLPADMKEKATGSCVETPHLIFNAYHYFYKMMNDK